MKRLFALILAVATAASWLAGMDAATGQSASDEALLSAEFDARELSRLEKRSIQRALSISGDYQGLLDGEWGRRSQAALEAYSTREFASLIVSNLMIAALIADTAPIIQEDGYETFEERGSGLVIELPMRRLSAPVDDGGGQKLESPDGGLSVWISYSSRAHPGPLHNDIRGRKWSAAERYVVDRETRLVTSDTTRDRAYYARSDKTPTGWKTVMVIADDSQNVRRLKIIASSIAYYESQAWLDAPQTWIDALLAATARYVNSEPAASERRDDQPPAAGAVGEQAGGSGSGFFVSATDIVTNHHVVEGCSEVTTAAGERLAIAFQDRARDLALLRGKARRRHWLSVATAERLDLGAEAFLIGYPYYGLASEDVTFTRGVVSSRTGFRGDSANFTLSAEMQPGNSGGPVLDRTGRVIGVAVARIDAISVAGSTGTLPQNMNYAITTETLRGFLQDAGVAFETAPSVAVDLSDSPLPGELETSVIAVLCR